MKTHIQRKHGGESKFSQAVDNRPHESNYRATTFKSYSNKSPYYDDFGDKHDDYFPFLEKMLVPMRKLKEFKQLWSELNPSSPMIDSLSILQEAKYRSSITPYSFSPNQRVEQPTNAPYSFSPNQRVEQPTNAPYSFSPNQRVEPPGSGNTLGYEAFVCDRCLRVDLHEALDSTHSRSIKLNHRCNEQVAIGSRLQ